jgi:hypothetical protein
VRPRGADPRALSRDKTSRFEPLHRLLELRARRNIDVDRIGVGDHRPQVAASTRVDDRLQDPRVAPLPHARALYAARLPLMPGCSVCIDAVSAADENGPWVRVHRGLGGRAGPKILGSLPKRIGSTCLSQTRRRFRVVSLKIALPVPVNGSRFHLAFKLGSDAVSALAPVLETGETDRPPTGGEAISRPGGDGSRTDFGGVLREVLERVLRVLIQSRRQGELGELV